MQVLNCKQHCAVELAQHAGRDEAFKDFLPSHFNYLQFSYYNSESPSAAALENNKLRKREQVPLKRHLPLL